MDMCRSMHPCGTSFGALSLSGLSCFISRSSKSNPVNGCLKMAGVFLTKRGAHVDKTTAPISILVAQKDFPAIKGPV